MAAILRRDIKICKKSHFPSPEPVPFLKRWARFVVKTEQWSHSGWTIEFTRNQWNYNGITLTIWLAQDLLTYRTERSREVSEGRPIIRHE